MTSYLLNKNATQIETCLHVTYLKFSHEITNLIIGGSRNFLRGWGGCKIFGQSLKLKRFLYIIEIIAIKWRRMRSFLLKDTENRAKNHLNCILSQFFLVKVKPEGGFQPPYPPPGSATVSAHRLHENLFESLIDNNMSLVFV